MFNWLELLVIAGALAIGGAAVAIGVPWWAVCLLPLGAVLLWLLYEITGWPR